VGAGAYGKISMLGPISRKLLVKQNWGKKKFFIKQAIFFFIQFVKHCLYVFYICLECVTNTFLVKNSLDSLTTVGSSETTREAVLGATLLLATKLDAEAPIFQYKGYFNFNDYIQVKPEHKALSKMEDFHFLEWFIGFTEGDGCFTVKEGRPVFIINQADLRVLNYIRTNLGFGIVRNYTQNAHVYGRFTVANKTNLQRLIALFNGNLHLQKKQVRFANFVNTYNNTFNTSIVTKPTLSSSLISLNTAWISGFFDAEGCCYAHYRNAPRMSSGRRLGLKAILTQKGELPVLKQIATLFSIPNVTIRNAEKQSYAIETASKECLTIIVRYLEQFKLQGRKKDAYAIWHRLAINFISGVHLSMNPIELAARVNKVKEQNQLFTKERSVLNLMAMEVGEEID
jgi:hypothetical protein